MNSEIADPLEEAPISRGLRVSDFIPHGKVATASWATRCISYPVGVRLAYLCYLLKLTPNQVSLLSLLVGLASCAIAAFVIPNIWQGGVILLVGLQLSYMLDCADGVLARATQRCSDFGAILDKTLDSMAIIIIPGILCVGSRIFHELPPGWNELPPGWVGLMIIFYATPRLSMAMVIWLKDYVKSGGDKSAVDQRQHTLVWKLSRCVAFLVDTPVCRFFLAISWVCGYLFPFLLCYGSFSWLALILYLYKSRREMS